MAKKKRQPIECVQAMPPACPKCGCTDRTEKAAIVSRNINGVTRDGRKYSKVQWNYCNCCNPKCKRRYKFMEYLHPVPRASELE